MFNPTKPRPSKRRRDDEADAHDGPSHQAEPQSPKRQMLDDKSRRGSNSASDGPATNPGASATEASRTPTTAAPSKRAEKKRKRRRAETGANAGGDPSQAANEGIGRMDGQMVADYVAGRTRRFEPELSGLELEERYLPARSVVETVGWEGARDLAALPGFLERFGGGGADLRGVEEEGGDGDGEGCGRPHTLVVAGAGLRAADVARSLRTFETKEGKVAKLFAKHIKFKEAVETCKTTRMNFGVGTPQRIMDLLENGALSSESLKRIVIDASHIDLKKRGILEMKDTQVPLVKLLNLPLLKQRYGAEDGIDLIFF